ncbi:MAG: M64 family metallopeptidase [Bdellovibrionales bacterium]
MNAYILISTLAMLIVNASGSYVAEATTWKTPAQALHEGLRPRPRPVIEVRLAFNGRSRPTLAIKGAQRTQGYAPPSPVGQIGEYQLILLGPVGETLSAVPVSVPIGMSSPPPLPGESGHEDMIVREQFEFVVPIDASPGAETVILADSKGEVSSAPIKENLEMHMPVQSASIRGDQIVRPQEHSWTDRQTWEQLLFGGISPTPFAQPQTRGLLDIVFIGDRFTNMSSFHHLVNIYASVLFEYEPFRSRAAQIALHYVDNFTDLGCRYHETVSRVIICNDAEVVRQVCRSGAPYDLVIVVLNSPNYGGAASGGNGLGQGLISTTYSGLDNTNLYVHELGHSLGNLYDEYNLYTTSGGTSNQTQGNCYPGTPPAWEWSGIVGSSDYTLGCLYPNWYRSSPNSLMLHLSHKRFNTVSQRLLNSYMNRYTSAL